MLRSNGTKTLVIGGGATEGGGEGTARSARNRELHDMALKLMEQTFFEVVPATNIGALWSRK